MRRNLLWALVVVVAAMLQSTWLDALRFRGVLPELPLLLAVYFAVNEGEERAMWTGALGGLLQDVFADTALGHHVLCLVLAGYAAGRVSRRLLAAHPAVKVGLVFCAALLHGFVFTLVLYIQDPGVEPLGIFAARAIPVAFYTAMVTPVIFFLMDYGLRRHMPVPRGAV